MINTKRTGNRLVVTPNALMPYAFHFTSKSQIHDWRFVSLTQLMYDTCGFMGKANWHMITF